MALDKPYKDIPGTTVFDAEQSRVGYHLNQFCMSLMKAENREKFKAGQRAYLDQWPMSEEQKQGVLARDYNRLISLGGNIYFLAKIFSSDGLSFEFAASTMTGVTPLEYRTMMIAGGRPPDGNRYLHEWANRPPVPFPPPAAPGAPPVAQQNPAPTLAPDPAQKTAHQSSGAQQ